MYLYPLSGDDLEETVTMSTLHIILLERRWKLNHLTCSELPVPFVVCITPFPHLSVCLVRGEFIASVFTPRFTL